MSDLKPEIHLMTPVPMRTADEQWQIAGYQCGVYAILDQEGLVFVDGKGGKACMRQDEWTAYQVLCLQGAPSISMMVVETEEDAELLSATRLRPNSDFARLDEIIEPETNEELQLTNRDGCLVATIKAEDHEAEWLLDEQGKFSTEGGAA